MVSLIADVAKFVAPTGVWASIINWVYSFVHSYGWTIILITVILKLIMLPLDFWQKYSQKAFSAAQQVMAPEIAAINKRYAYDKNILNQKQSEVYKKHGVNPMGNCFAMIVNLVVVFVVFISLINGITAMANYKIEDQFYKLEIVYQTAEEAGENPEEAVKIAFQNDKNIKENFLWIKNIWRKDTSESVIPAYKDVVTKDYKADAKEEDKKGFYSRVSEERYNKIMTPLMDNTKGQWNGYYILAALAVILSLLSGYITTKQNKTDKNAPAQKSGWIMQIIMVVIMGAFALTSASTFALYLVVSQLLTVVTTFGLNPLVNLALKRKAQKKDKKDNDNTPTISYSRY